MMSGMDTPTPITPAGWYDDGHGQLRWWDGSRWTEHTAPPAVTQPVRPQPRPAARPAAELTPVKRSKLVWILPLVMVLTALIGGVLGAVSVGAVTDTDPAEQAYAGFLQAERTRDCDLLEDVTTPGFRDRLVSGPMSGYSCRSWQARPSMRTGEVTWAVRLGPFAILDVRERYADPTGISRSITYYAVERNGRWQLADTDTSGQD